jgi:hypothetical protein
MSTMRHHWLRSSTVLMLTLMFMLGIGPRAFSGMVPSTPPAGTEINRAHDLQMVQTALEQKQVQAQLLAAGYTADEVATRLDRMSDADLHQLALHAEQAQAAGWVGFVLAVMVIALIAVIIYYLLEDAQHNHM